MYDVYLYEAVTDCIKEEFINDNITLDEAIMLNKIAFNKIILEKEEDHESHMKYKEQASKRKNIPENKMVNKKYKKDPEKADKYYNGREKLIKKDKYNNGNSYIRNKRLDNIPDDVDDRLYNKYYHDIEVEDSDIALKALSYMKKHTNLKNPKEYRKYKVAFNIFCRRFKIDENSSIWVKYNPGSTIKYNGETYKDSDRITVGSYTDSKPTSLTNDTKEKNKKKTIIDKIKERKINLPNGYRLVHSTNKIGLTELKPQSYSSNYIGKGPGGLGGQYHSTGRVYFTLTTKEKLDKSSDARSYGKHLYELVSPVKEVYFDTEHGAFFNDKEDMSNPDIEKLVGKPVYVKTNKPLKVKMTR